MRERILRRLRFELRMLVQTSIPVNLKYKPKGVVSVTRSNDPTNRYFEINPPYTSELKLTPAFVEACSPYIKPIMKVDIPGDFVVGLKNGRMYCSDSSHIATVNENGYVVEELSFQWGDERIDPAKENRIFKNKGFIRPKVYKGRVFSLMSGGGAKYFLYHWLLETVPKMYLFQQSGELDKDSYFIVPSQRTPYHREFLKHFGIDEQHIINEEDVHHIKAEWLFVTSHVKYFDHHPRWSCDFLYASVVRNPVKQPKKRIYISRGDARKTRTVVKEPELIEMLKRHGFESVELARLSIYEKAEVFNSASILVAVHGGGLANLAYCQPGTRILEIFPDQYVRHAYFDMADKRNLCYDYLLLPTVGTATNALQGQKLGVILDIGVVEAKVLSMLGETNGKP